MKKVQTLFFLSFLLSLSPDLIVAQHNENWLEKNDPISYAKLYLHTDREFYFYNDTIWFKAYYLDGQSQQFISGFYTMYVDLFDEKGRTIANQVLPITNGITSGNLPIPDSIKKGNYLLRAFTDFQKCFGEDAFFYKTLNISKVKNTPDIQLNESKELSAKTTGMDVSFLPEGGFLLSDQQNTIGIKAIDEKGKGLAVKGAIINSKDQVVTFFATTYKGMGRLVFKPKSGETYRAKLEGDPDFEYEFKNIVAEGIKLEIIQESENELLLNVVSNSESFNQKAYIMAIIHRGKVLLYQEFIQRNTHTQIKINAQNLPSGINRAVLLDKQLNPISERLFFRRNFDINEIQIALNQSEYETRTNLQLELLEKDTLVKNSFSNLSVSVLDENELRVNGPTMDIRSWLLINSELNGNIEAPADFFTNDESISSESKLNLLMLTQGWSNYIWNTIPENKIDVNFKFNQGITLQGRVKRWLGRKPVTDGNIVIGIKTVDFFRVYEDKTDADGRFSIDGIFFTDSASIFVQARNGIGKLTTELFLDPLFGERPRASEIYLQRANYSNALSIRLFRQKYYSDLAMKAFSPDEGAIMLNEVLVKGERIVKAEDPAGVYPKPNVSLKINQKDISKAKDLFSYLQSRVPGLVIHHTPVDVFSGKPAYEVTIRGPSSFLLDYTPLFLLNEAEVPIEVFENLDMNNIDRVEIYINANETSLFGMRGSNGVISVYTKKGPNMDYKTPNTMGTISAIVKGYEAYREFYSPKYTTDNLNSERPDNRITLYWNPNVITENGKASLSFFTSDDLANYKIFVEGITSDGKICLGTAEFSVNEYNRKLVK